MLIEFLGDHASFRFRSPVTNTAYVFASGESLDVENDKDVEYMLRPRFRDTFRKWMSIEEREELEKKQAEAVLKEEKALKEAEEKRLKLVEDEQIRVSELAEEALVKEQTKQAKIDYITEKAKEDEAARVLEQGKLVQGNVAAVEAHDSQLQSEVTAKVETEIEDDVADVKTETSLEALKMPHLYKLLKAANEMLPDDKKVKVKVGGTKNELILKVQEARDKVAKAGGRIKLEKIKTGILTKFGIVKN